MLDKIAAMLKGKGRGRIRQFSVRREPTDGTFKAILEVFDGRSRDWFVERETGWHATIDEAVAALLDNKE